MKGGWISEQPQKLKLKKRQIQEAPSETLEQEKKPVNEIEDVDQINFDIREQAFRQKLILPSQAQL